MSKSTCCQPECDRATVAKRLCMKHYQRARAGRPLELPEKLTCESCLVEFKPEHALQKHCTRQCGANAAARRFYGYDGPVPRCRPCDYCGTEFERQGQGRQKYCSLACVKIARSIRGHMRDYGLSKAGYRALLEAQGGVCGSCKKLGTDGRKTVLCVDHCHETGRVRGLLCGRCNAAIGLLGDTLAGVESAAAYLRAVV